MHPLISYLLHQSAVHRVTPTGCKIINVRQLNGDPQLPVLMRPTWRTIVWISMQKCSTTWGLGPHAINIYWVARGTFRFVSLRSTGFFLSMAQSMLVFLVTLCLSFPSYTFADTSHFKLVLTWGKGAPDGYERDMIFTNGQYPGPLLDIRQDDWVEIEVVNLMSFNTTIHAHGMQRYFARMY